MTVAGLVEKFPGLKYLWRSDFNQNSADFLHGGYNRYFYARGMGLMGVNHPVGWGTDIITFVFWIGIGHAGTLISAILFLFRQKWRTSIAQDSRSHDSICCFNRRYVSYNSHWAGPGSGFLASSLILTKEGLLWVNFRSPLIWDVFAVSTYAHRLHCCFGILVCFPI